MHVITPEFISDATLISSNVLENDYPVWSAGTNYPAGTRVILTTGYHKVYQSLANNTNIHPVTDPSSSTHWVEISATNRWKAFDDHISDPTVRAGSIFYELQPSTLIDSLVFFGLKATSVRIVVKDGGVTFYDNTFSLVDRTDSVTWFSWFFDPIQYDTELLANGFGASVGQTIEITITSSGDVEVGQIVMGRDRKIGNTNLGTQVGIKDYSRKERDAFGNALIVERGFSDTVDYKFTFPAEDARRVKRILAAVKAIPCVYHAGDDTTKFGTTVYGFYSSFEIPLTDKAVSFATLQVEGLT